MKRAKQSPGTLAAVINLYRLTEKYRGLSHNTKVAYEYGYRIARDVLGECPVLQLTTPMMQHFFDQFDAHPATKKIVRTAFVSLEKWALRRGHWGPYPIVRATEATGGTGAREPWTDEEVKLALDHATPALARAVLLARTTGQRVGDLCAMRWTDINRDDDGFPRIAVIQQKTDLQLWVPIVPELEAALDQWDRSLGYLLTKPNGRPWADKELSRAWYVERENNASLATLRPKRLSLHGLRASAVIALRRAGWTDAEVSSFVGMSEQMVSRYARKSEKWQNVRKAMNRTGTGPEQSNVFTMPSRKLTD